MTKPWGTYKPRFHGEVVTRWSRERGADRCMDLLENLIFIDSRGIWWLALRGSRINGASIPRVLWSLIGDPYTGDYRRASVVHDVACEHRNRPYQDVHRMFYEAMLADGLRPSKAWVMYQAVRAFGPRW